MNQFKEDLNHELRAMSLSNEKKQFIAMKAKSKIHRQQRPSQWQYRFVLATFTIFVLSFGYLLLQQGESVGKLQGAEPIEPATTMSWSILNHDFVKILLLISFFVILRTVIKRRRHRSGKGLPVCLECSEEWTFREASKQSWKSDEMTCPYCAHKQYRTKKSIRKINLLNIPLLFMIIAIQLFDNFLLGISFYIPCAAYFLFSLNPYFIEFQETNPINELWGDDKK